MFDSAQRPEPQPRANVFCVATYMFQHLVPGASSMLIDIRAGSRVPLQVNWQVATSDRSRTVRLGVENDYPSACQRTLSSHCSELPHPVLAAAQVLFSVFPFSPTSQFTSKTCHAAVLLRVPEPASVTVVPKHFKRGPPVGSYVVPAKYHSIVVSSSS